MKTNKDVRVKNQGVDSDEFVRHGAKLAPAKKSGKERHNLYASLEEEDDEDLNYKPRESTLDYFDDGQEA